MSNMFDVGVAAGRGEWRSRRDAQGRRSGHEMVMFREFLIRVQDVARRRRTSSAAAIGS